MTFRHFVRDATIGLAAGYAGGRAMTPVTTKFYAMESTQSKDAEKKVSPGIAYDIAAKDLSGRIGITLDDKQAQRVGTYFHSGLALTGGEIYMLLRHRFGLNPLIAALAMSMTLWLGMDEGMTPAMGWSAPDPKYPIATHLRGLAGHLTLGFGTAVAAEVLHWLTGGGK